MSLVTDTERTPTPPERKGSAVGGTGNAPVRLLEKWNRQLIDALPAAVYTCDAGGWITWCNDAAVELWGRRPELGVERWNGAHRVYRVDGSPCPVTDLPAARALREGRSITREDIIIERPDGTRRHVLANPQLTRDENGVVDGLVNMLFDVTEARRDELDARRLAAIVESSEDAILGMDLFGTITSWNAGAERLYGFSAAEAIGRPAAMLMPPDRGHEEDDILQRVRRGEKIEPADTVRHRKDGSRIEVSLTVSPIKDGQGRIIGASKIARDITAQKNAIRALAASEERLRLATHTGKVGLWEWDIAANRVTWTDSLYEIHGVSPDGFAATIESFVALIHPDDRAPVERAIQSALRHDVPYELEFRAVRPSGGIVWLFTNAIVEREHGEPRRLLGATFDVTARKLAELALRESEKRFRTLASHAPVGIFLADPQGETLFVNEAWAKMSDLTAAEARGSGWERSMHPDDRERVAAEWHAACREQRASQAEYRFVRADGSIRWVQGNAVPLRDDAGRIAGYIGTINDVTQRKLADEKMRAHQAQLQVISTNAPISLAHCSRDGRFLFVNRANAQRFGLEPEQMIGQRLEDVIGQEAVAAIRPYIDRVLQGESIDYEAEVPYKTIGTRFMRASYVPDFAEDGSVRGWMSALSDLTDRREMENALREGEERFRMVADNIAALAWTADRLGWSTWYNQRWYDYTGTTFEEMRDRGWERLQHPDHLERVKRKLQVCLERSESWEDTFPLRGRDGVYRWFLSRAVPIKDAKGQVVRWFGTNTDVTELREAQEKVRIAQEQLQAHATELEQKVEERTASLREAIAQMEEFSYSVSHDLRAPLRAMKGYADALAEDYGDRLDETAKGYLERIQRSSVRMENLTHDLLTYSRVARAQVELAELDLEALLRDLIAQYSELQPAAADLSIETPLHRVRGHESSLGQALANLLTNAAKFVAPGVRPRIRVWTQPAGERVRVWVEDNGIGIAPEHQAALFRVFERVPTHQSYEGTGIGLAIVRKAVEKMGGGCGVESDGRHGSRFWIELPKA